MTQITNPDHVPLANPGPRAYWLAGAIAGFGAALVMLAVSLGLRQWTGVPTLTEVLADGFTSFIPLGLFEAALAILESSAKRMLFIGIVALVLVIGAAVGLAIAAMSRRLIERGDDTPWRLGAIAGVGAWLLMMVAVLPLFGAGFFAGGLRAGSYIAVFALAEWLLYGLAAVGLFWQLAPRSVAADELDRASDLAASQSRRRALFGGAIAALAATFAFLGYRSVASAPVFRTARAPETEPVAVTDPTTSAPGVGGPPVTAAAPAGTNPSATVSSPANPIPSTPQAPPEASAAEVPGMTLAITPNKDFYTISKNVLDPKVDIDRWKFELTGLVEKPITLTYDEFVRLPSREQFSTLQCISNEVGGDLMGNAIWRGVPLKTLLEMAKPLPGVVKVVARAWDDYSDSFTFDRAMADGNLIAWEMNGVTLPHDHGFPIRLLVPGIYGMKNLKWITKIELVDYDYKGFWQQRGWSDDATILTSSRIDAPQRSAISDHEARYLGGVAFAGDRGVTRVEVSLDNGATWQAAELKQAVGPYSWVLWVYNWKGEAGGYTVKVRATDGAGIVQTDKEAPPLPDGASGWHTRRFKIG